MGHILGHPLGHHCETVIEDTVFCFNGVTQTVVFGVLLGLFTGF